MASTTTRTMRAPKTITRDELLENPEAANAEIASVVQEATAVELPKIDFPSENVVDLPGGFSYKGVVHKFAEVRELTGKDEEYLARTAQSQNFNAFLFMDRLLRCGVVRVGSIPESETENLLPDLLIGDREMLILGIRKATYGKELEIPDWICPKCGTPAELEMELSDIPVINLDNYEVEFDVPLRNESTAHIRLAIGSDQSAMFEKQELTYAQRETILLSKCVEYITDKFGYENYMASKPSMARELSISDRHKILDELDSKQPGPKYNKVDYTCENCGEKSLVTVNIGHLFRHFRWI